eukprot:GILI01015584.1.p1 GENE.GILI01015584.1~~GILI01015584.1.p1  ORF type:complete len:257 (+),score=14.46 GILI01015584.1:61-831(+)
MRYSPLVDVTARNTQESLPCHVQQTRTPSNLFFPKAYLSFLVVIYIVVVLLLLTSLVILPSCGYYDVPLGRTLPAFGVFSFNFSWLCSFLLLFYFSFALLETILLRFDSSHRSIASNFVRHFRSILFGASFSYTSYLSVCIYCVMWSMDESSSTSSSERIVGLIIQTLCSAAVWTELFLSPHIFHRITDFIFVILFLTCYILLGGVIGAPAPDYYDISTPTSIVTTTCAAIGASSSYFFGLKIADRRLELWVFNPE